MRSITSTKTTQPWKITAPSHDRAEKGSKLTSKMVRETPSTSRLAEKTWIWHGSHGFEGGQKGRFGAREWGGCCRAPYQAVLAAGIQKQVASFFCGKEWEKCFQSFSGYYAPVGSFGVYLWCCLYCITAFSQSVSPNAVQRKQRNLRAEGVWSEEGGGHGLRATFSCETARNGGRQELGRGRTRSNEGVWGDQLLGQDGGGTKPTQVPARSSSQARFREEPISPFCFFTWLCCPVQISDCSCFIQLFRHMHLDSAFAVNDLQ